LLRTIVDPRPSILSVAEIVGRPSLPEIGVVSVYVHCFASRTVSPFVALCNAAMNPGTSPHATLVVAARAEPDIPPKPLATTPARANFSTALCQRMSRP
jgi:hypothetical protein